MLVLNHEKLRSFMDNGNSAPRTNDEALSNNSETEQKNDETSVSIEPVEQELPKFEETVNIVIEDVENQDEVLDLNEPATDNPLALQIPDVDNFEEDFIPMRDEDFLYNDLIHKDPNEIMDTAAGFVPIPIFRKKKKPQKPRQPFASRRYFRRPYPYRRLYYFYPYYRYYPSSLRFY
ncbi:unnamed protein product, partial [Brenthis ino]